MFAISLDASREGSLQAQLIAALRHLVSATPDVQGARLPATRVLAAELSVSRTTVQTAYDQLISEGLFLSKRGSGTFVAKEIAHLAQPPKGQAHRGPRPVPTGWRPFETGLPDQSLMPHKLWAGHLERAWRAPNPSLLARPDVLGWPPLRETISDHLEAWRGLACTPEQIVITSGAREAFEIVFNGILPRRGLVAIEDPSWPKMRRTLNDCGQDVHPIRIDDRGLDSAQIPKPASAVIVTPSRHYPTGTSLPLSRRTALLAWARDTGATILEDDYDSEFRYRGQPLPSLAGLDGLAHTVYLGSFSKLISPALRIGYLAVPRHAVSKVQDYLRQVGPRASLVPQPALASFMQSGDYAQHLRRMRRVYAQRQKHLLATLAPVSDLLDLRPDPSGMHLCVPLRPEFAKRVTDTDISECARVQGLRIGTLSGHCLLEPKQHGLLLGYSAFDETALSQAAQTLATVVRNAA